MKTEYPTSNIQYPIIQFLAVAWSVALCLPVWAQEPASPTFALG